jgi:hypothetical protein
MTVERLRMFVNPDAEPPQWLNVVRGSDYDAVAARLEGARTALGDIAMSSKLTLDDVRALALRVYWGTADQPNAGQDAP